MRRRYPAPWTVEEHPEFLRCPRRYRPEPRLRLFRGGAAAADDAETHGQGRCVPARPRDHADTGPVETRLNNVYAALALPRSCAIFPTQETEGRIMVALRSERRVFLWRIHPRPVPLDSKKTVTFDECLKILETAFKAGTARAYLGVSGILDDNSADRDEKNQIYIAQITRNVNRKTVTLLINRGDPNVVSPAFINFDFSSARCSYRTTEGQRIARLFVPFGCLCDGRSRRQASRMLRKDASCF